MEVFWNGVVLEGDKATKGSTCTSTPRRVTKAKTYKRRLHTRDLGRPSSRTEGRADEWSILPAKSQCAIGKILTACRDDIPRLFFSERRSSSF